jgi:hypothetical protein
MRIALIRVIAKDLPLRAVMERVTLHLTW